MKPVPEQEVGGPGAGQQEPHAVLVVEEPRVVAPHGPSAMDMVQLAVEKDLDIEKLERLIALRNQEADRQAAKDFGEALAAFQAECPPITKNKTGKVATDTGTKFEYMYAELPMIAKTIAPFLHKRGFSYSWNTPRMEAGNLTVECKLRHANGHSETSTCTLPVATRAGMSEQQKVASARKFGERLTLIQVLGITTADPDMDGAEIGAADPTPITELQAHDLEAKAEELKVVKSDFLKFLGVESFATIRASDHKKAINALKERERTLTKKARPA